MHVLDKYLNSQYSQDTSYPAADVLSEIIFQKQVNLYIQDHGNTHTGTIRNRIRKQKLGQEGNRNIKTEKYLEEYFTRHFLFCKAVNRDGKASISVVIFN